MRSSILKCLAAALVVAAVLVPAAAAKSHHPTPKLGLVPLPKARLGSAAAGLHIALGSGPQYAYTAKGNHLTGYALVYGSPFLANPGLDEVATTVDRYKTARAARRELKQRRKDNFGSSSILGNLTQLNLTATETLLGVPPVGDTHWASLLTLSVPDYGSVYLVDEEFRDGKYVLGAQVAAGSQDLATSYAASKAGMLDTRLHAVLSGRLHGHSVAVPKFGEPGPPKSGLDPATAVLQTSDLPGSAIDFEAYGYGSGALSSYGVYFKPGGSFDEVSQFVNVMPSTNSAGFSAAFLGAEFVALPLSLPGIGSNQVTLVDASTVGDEAQAAIVTVPGSGKTTYYVVIALHREAMADIVLAASTSTIDSSDVQTLAQSAATRLDAALP